MIGSAPVDSTDAGRPTGLDVLARIAFAIGLAAYLVIQGGVMWHIVQQRTVPVETDDAYTYIQKAVQLRACPRQSCPALEDLRTQLVPRTQEADDYLRWRTYHNAISIYHPLHSMLLLTLRVLFPDWEHAYDALQVGGAVFIGIAAAMLLWVLWGPGAAGVALILLAGANHFLYIAPSTLSLGIALSVWAATIARPGVAGWIVAVGVCLMIAMHPIARAYALPSVALLVTVRGWRASRTAIGLTALAVAASAVLTVVVRRPDLLVAPEPFPHWWGSWPGLQANFVDVRHIASGWLSTHGGALLASAMLAVGLATTDAPKLRSLAVLLLILAALLGAAVFHVLSDPADVFRRMWPAGAILLAGLIGRGIWWSVAAMVLSLGGPRASLRLLPSSRGMAAVCAVVFSVGIVELCRATVHAQLPDLKQTIDLLSSRQHVSLDSSQPATLLDRGCTQVLYTAEVPMHFYFTRGALQCGAVYLPTLAGTSDAARLTTANGRLSHLVDWNPAVSSELMDGGRSLTLSGGDRLEVRSSAPRRDQAIYLLLENAGPSLILAVEHENNETGERSQRTLPLAAWSSAWHLASEHASGMTRVWMPAAGVIRLRGLRTSLNESLNWPWDSGLTLQTIEATNAAVRTIDFDLERFRRLMGRPVRVIHDSGDTVLVESANREAREPA